MDLAADGSVTSPGFQAGKSREWCQSLERAETLEDPTTSFSYAVTS